MNILGIIPARKGSTRIKDKNIKKLGGKPLVKFAIDNALNSKLIDKIVVSTNSAEVLEMDRDYSERVFFLKRPEAISGDKSTSIDFVNHVLDHEEHNNQIYDIIVILQPTSPLTSPNDIDNTINLLINSDADSAVSVVRLAHDVNPIKMKIFNGSKLIPYLED